MQLAFFKNLKYVFINGGEKYTKTCESYWSGSFTQIFNLVKG